ncbi:MAG TPA: metallophosphoesterase family protein, partial [bacterium]|nr:metallophosphoesterase family protein [bacterium]
KEKFIAFKFAYEHLTDENKTFLTELPREYRTEINGYKLLAVHGSPDTIEEHLSKDTPKKRFIEIAKNADADIIVSGHSHNFFTKKINNVLFVNTGSVGRQNDGNPEAEYVILNILRNKIKINNYRVKYDINKTIETIKKNGLPEIFCEMIKCGRSLDYLLDEKLLNSNYLEKAQAFGEKYNYEYEHSQQVRKLSLILFDKLKCLHNLGAVERLYLECAALLHDIGFYYGSKKHNKHSFNMILENEELPFTEKQKLMIALIARYHRKKMPNEKKHKYFAALGKTDREIVKKTAALLRIADGLDVTHNNTVADIECKIKNNKVIIKCISDKDLALERCQAL